MKKTLFKFVAWGFLISSMIIGLFVISSIFFISFLVPEAKLIKLIFLDAIIFLVGFFIILVGFGLFEFFLSLIDVEEELKEIEKKIENENASH